LAGGALILAILEILEGGLAGSLFCDGFWESLGAHNRTALCLACMKHIGSHNFCWVSQQSVLAAFGGCRGGSMDDTVCVLNNKLAR